MVSCDTVWSCWLLGEVVVSYWSNHLHGVVLGFKTGVLLTSMWQSLIVPVIRQGNSCLSKTRVWRLVDAGGPLLMACAMGFGNLTGGLVLTER
jgi:hypothetical protein